MVGGEKKCSLCLVQEGFFILLQAPVFTLYFFFFFFLTAPALPVSCWVEQLPYVLVTEPALALACLPALRFGGMRESQACTRASPCLASDLFDISFPECSLLSSCLTLPMFLLVLCKCFFEGTQFTGGGGCWLTVVAVILRAWQPPSSSCFAFTSGSF